MARPRSTVVRWSRARMNGSESRGLLAARRDYGLLTPRWPSALRPREQLRIGVRVPELSGARR